ncbi:hypothetical protein INT44_000035 [Umbelopsis vinacea]|uniref:Uncharacterized protein n=1 Tax=Umbelopsis vinacea TaxID=44442 RepID=A0A8H7PH76_9FUNG|nr:hypothetical protein INT44_000035 [Umbelopsis vinacea]
MSRISVRCIQSATVQTAAVPVRAAPMVRPATITLRPTIQPHGSSLFVNSANLISSMATDQRRAIHCTVAIAASKESESVTKDLEGKNASKPYNEGHGTASADDVAKTEAAFDTDSVDPKDEMDKAEDTLDVSGANEKASPTPGNDD